MITCRRGFPNASNPYLGRLLNSGWVTFGDDGSIYFAPALRPELRRYSADGHLLWVSRWTRGVPEAVPKLVARTGALSADFTQGSSA